MSQLDHLPIEGASALWKAVRRGEKDFVRDILRIPGTRIHMSKTHSFEDARTQAFILSIPSKENQVEAKRKSYLTFLAHWFDDYVDNSALSDQVFNMKVLYEKRNRRASVFEEMGAVGKLIVDVSTATPHPEGVLKGLYRVFYDGLIGQAKRHGFDLGLLLREYQSISLAGLERGFAEEARTIGPHVYHLTTKGLQELFCAVDKQYDPNVAEAWSLIYCPAVYLHNHREEAWQGEHNTDIPLPTLSELCSMIDIGARHGKRFPDPLRKGREEQLVLVLKSFKRLLPEEILHEYHKVLAGMVAER